MFMILDEADVVSYLSPDPMDPGDRPMLRRFPAAIAQDTIRYAKTIVYVYKGKTYLLKDELGSGHRIEAMVQKLMDLERFPQAPTEQIPKDDPIGRIAAMKK